MHQESTSPVSVPADAPDDLPASRPHLLDNPIWNALTGEHEKFARGVGPARSYDPAIGPLSGIADSSEATYEALRALVGPGGVVVVFYTEAPATPVGWSLLRGAEMVQMVHTSLNSADSTSLELSPRVEMRRLTRADVPAMIALAELTEPGPFRNRTIELGDFWGIFEDKRLLAMAGQRMRVPGFAEVSAVCTHPDARGRGYARHVMGRVIKDIRAEGRTPFLHSLASNEAAIRVYRNLGFAVRRTLHVGVWKNER